MAASQKATIPEISDSPALSQGFGSAASLHLQLPLKDNSEDLSKDLKYHNNKTQAFNRHDSYSNDNGPGKRNIGKNGACPRFASDQSSQCCISNEEEKLKALKMEQSASAENVSMLHCLHSLQVKTLCSGNPEGLENQSSGTCNIVKQSSLKQAGTHQQQLDSEIIDNVIGDELDIKATAGHHSCLDATETAALEKQLASLSQDPEKLPDAVTGRTSCASHFSPRRSHSDHCLTESHNETKSQLQPVSCSEGLKQLISTQIESAVSRFSSSSSSSSSSLSSLSTSLLVEGRTLGSEQISHCVDPSNPSRQSIPQTSTNMPNNTEAVELGVTQDSHVTLLKALLAEKDEDLNQLSKELNKLQRINKQLLEEQCLVMSTNKGLQKETNKVLEDKLKDESDSNPTAPAVLQQRIEDLKSYLKDLQEANDSALNELTKADEEISQLRGEITKLRLKHAEELQDAKQESDYFKYKINRLHCDPFLHTLENTTFGFLDEIQQLRNESRKLREANHRLDEENRLLKEVLWDFKQQREWLSKKNSMGKNVEITKMGANTMSAQKAELPKKEQETVLQKTSSLPSQLQGASPPSLLRFEYFNIEEKSGLTKSSEGVNSMTFDQRLQTWDDEDKDRATSSASPVSVDSDSTEVLLASYSNGTLNQAPSSNKQQPGDSLLDLDGLSDDDMPSVSQINGRHQFPYEQCSNSTPCKSIPSSGFWSSCLNRKKTVRSIVNKAVLPRRPFAPRGIADLKIGHLVKFSRPAGKISKGVIKYLGHLPGRQEAYLGIELEGDEIGRHNGTFEGARYFICKLNKGVFVNFSKVIMAWE